MKKLTLMWEYFLLLTNKNLLTQKCDAFELIVKWFLNVFKNETDIKNLNKNLIKTIFLTILLVVLISI